MTETARLVIEVDYEKLLNLWACLVLALNDDSYVQEAYHQLYTAHDKYEDGDPFEAFSGWWTHADGEAALKRMGELIGEPGKDTGTAVQRDGEGL